MAEVIQGLSMVNNLVAGISRALKIQWPGVKVYDEPIYSGIVLPCFTVIETVHTVTHRIGGLDQHRAIFDVAYTSEDTRDRKSINDTAEALSDVLRFLEDVDGNKFAFGFDMDYSVVDEILHFSVTFMYRTVTVEDDPLMEELELTQEVNDDG